MSEVIRYGSSAPNLLVQYSPRGVGHEPKAWAVVANPDGHANFMANLMSTDDHIPSMTRTITASGLSADAVADVWTRYQRLRTVVADTERPGTRWKQWAKKHLPDGPPLTRPLADIMLVQAITQEEKTLAEHKQSLHPIAAEMRYFLLGRLQLENMNGSRPPDELLPPPTLIDPIEVVGMVALDLYQRE